MKSSVALGEEERRRLGGFGRGKSVWAEGVRSDFIVPLIPDTSGMNTGHVRYSRAGPNKS